MKHEGVNVNTFCQHQMCIADESPCITLFPHRFNGGEHIEMIIHSDDISLELSMHPRAYEIIVDLLSNYGIKSHV